MKLQILFVDDQPKVLQSIRRMLHGMRREWDMTFAQSGHEALDLLAKSSSDVVVTDMRMPQMDGAQLLTEVKKQYPHMVRIVLSGHSDKDMILKSVQPAHQYLSKPCDAETLKSTISRTCALRSLLSQESLKRIVSKIDSLPSLPSLYTEITKELQSSDPSIQKIGQIISKDLGMTAKVLQLVNSAFFGIPRHIEDPAQAASLLGIDTIKALVLTAEVFSKFDQVKLAAFDIERLWDHSFMTGELVKQIVKAEGVDKQTADDAYLAGLLHDIGKLVLVDAFADKYKEILDLAGNEKIILAEAENQVLRISHAEVGAYLLGLWGLPDPIVVAIGYHHHPFNCPEQSLIPLTAVHAADALINEDGLNPKAESSEQLIDSEYLAVLGLSERISAWRENYAHMVREGK